jgi:hypothetical protein
MTRSGAVRCGKIALLAVAALASSARGVYGQQAERERPIVRAPREGLVEFEDAQELQAVPDDEESASRFNVLVYGQGDPDGARRRLESRLRSRIEQIDRVCKLTQDQTSKLNVAGRGDIKRAFARAEELKAKHASVRPGVEGERQLARDIAEYRRAMTELDCFGDGSLFLKILPKTLTARQWALREKSIRDASNVQHRSTIRWAVGSLDIWLQLGTERREKLEQLLISRTVAPRKFGEYDYYGLVFQVSKLPEKELRPLFDDGQWQKIGRQFAEAQRLEKVLRLGGFLPEEDVADAGKARRNDPIAEPEGPRS